MNDIKEYINLLRPEGAGQTITISDKDGYDNIGEKLVPLELSDALALIGRMKSDYLAALAEERARIVSGQFMQICGYCGEEVQPPSQWEKLQDHIQKCPKHPLAKAKEQIASLTESCDYWRRLWRLTEAAERKAEEEIAALKEALGALGIAADMVHTKMFVIQPFLNVFKKYGDIITDCMKSQTITEKEEV